MNFWTALADELNRWENSIATSEDCPEVQVGQLPAWLKERTPEGNAACEQWIQTGQWPEWTSELRWQIALRLNWARHMAVIQSWATWPPPGREEALRWLLIACWPAYVETEVDDYAAGNPPPPR